MEIKTRLRNYGLWIAVIAFIPIFLQGIGVNVLSENYQELAMSLLGIFVLLGIVNNPTSEDKGFKDDKK